MDGAESHGRREQHIIVVAEGKDRIDDPMEADGEFRDRHGGANGIADV